ncbi:MAG TPA: hypothetical protein VGG11_15425 [Xanthobacteraceae bacterium]|jgi:hypothetical protein
MLSAVACWMAYCAVRAKFWRLGLVFSAGVLCFFGTFVPACLYQFSHDPSLKWVAAACLAGAGILMALGWALKIRGSASLAGLAVLLSLGIAGLLVQALRLVLPPSYAVLTYVLSGTAFVLMMVALRYNRFFRRDNSGTE